MHILIIEDEKPAAERLKALAAPLLPQAAFHGHLDSISGALQWLQTHSAPDLIFCDIQLADGYSFEIFEQLRVSSPIIFTTAFDQYAIKAFKHNSIDYLLKPIDPKELAYAIHKFKNQHINKGLDLNILQGLLKSEKTYKERFMVKVGEKIHTIPTPEISFFYSESKATFLQTKENRRYLIDYTLEQLESMLDSTSVFRLNRKYLASIDAIEGIFTYSNSRLKVKLKNCDDNDILISREKVGEFKEWLDR
jgi:DNA-binding LytR/AlgR family response regulator